jgi:maltose alpha-D-glucosyltransferase/alpha-amylase
MEYPMTQRKEPAWLKDAVFYEIYPQSFYDTNGDGIGDLKGIIQKLDYVRDLGCTGLWINPCFESPFQDAGYDVSDYTRIAPRYGTNDDMKTLCREAKKKGIRVLLDLVPGHTSIQHPWFKESCKPEKNRYSDWYVWTDSGWTWSYKDLKLISGYADRDGCYVTNFFYSQPALNFGFAKPDPKAKWQKPVDHPAVKEVRREIWRIMEFWLDMGVSGFRVDMAGSLVKMDKDGAETAKFWTGIRRRLDRDYPEAVLVSEWGNPPAAVNKAAFHVDFLLPWGSTAFSKALFRNEENGKPSIFSKDGGDFREFSDRYTKILRQVEGRGRIALISGNHDTPRFRKGRTLEELKTLFAFILTMPSVPFIYYGDEIGMRYLQLPSKEGGLSRTGTRTPMQWTKGRNAGFSRAKTEDLYLPVDPAADRPDVASQEGDPDSLLETVRELIQLRKLYPSLGTGGGFKLLSSGKSRFPIVYLRETGGEKIVVALNPTARPVKASFQGVRFTDQKTIAGAENALSRSGKKASLIMGKNSFSIVLIQ